MEAYDAIVLVEGSEAEIFVEPERWFFDLDILAVDCGGFSGVGEVYEKLSDDFEGRLVPTVDKDSLPENKPADSSAAWNSSNQHIFSWTFEGAFEDWILAEAINSEWEKKPEWSNIDWELNEQDVIEAREKAKERGEGIYSAIEKHGRDQYPEEGFGLPSKPDLARRLGERMKCHHWIPARIKEWIRQIYSVADQPIDSPIHPDNTFNAVHLRADSRFEPVNWDLAQEKELTGFLVMCNVEDRELIGVDFDQEIIGPLSVQPNDVNPKLHPIPSPDGDAILVYGKSETKNKMVTAILYPDGTQEVIELGGSNRSTAPLDWGPRGHFVYIHGPDRGSNRMWRRSVKDATTKRVEPETHGGVLRKVGSTTLGLGSSNNRTQAFELQDLTLVREKSLEDWHPDAKCHQSTTRAWDYNRDDEFFFALAEPTVNGGGDCPMRIFTGRLDPTELEVVDARELVGPLRRLMSLCWSPSSESILGTSPYEKMVHLIDVETGCLKPLIRGRHRVSGRSWLPSRTSAWQIRQ